MQLLQNKYNFTTASHFANVRSLDIVKFYKGLSILVICYNFATLLKSPCKILQNVVRKINCDNLHKRLDGVVKF